jgi:hypothetical protein
MTLHSDTSFWFQASQSLLLLKKPRTGLQSTIYRTRGEHVKDYTADAGFSKGSPCY